MSASEQHTLITQAQQGNLSAYDNLVHLYQDMAVAYGVSVLGDFHLAQDAAQEAFIEAFLCLPTLREPHAFPSWLRRIVWKHCDRITRRKTLATIPLESAIEVSDSHSGPQGATEEAETRALVRHAIATLPEKERVVVLLFYMGEHSQTQIAAFLELPVTAIKKRLQRARQKLKARMIHMIENELEEQRPSKKPEFTEQIHTLVSSGIHEVYEVKVKGDDETYTIVMLKAQDHDRFLPIYIGPNEARSIAVRLRGQNQQRPRTYTLMAELMSRLGGTVESVTIGTQQDNVYYATLRVAAQGQIHEIDCRPSDALALAVQVNAPVFVLFGLFYEDATFEATRLHETVECLTPLVVN